MTITRPQLIAANDNVPRHADEFADDLAVRRAWLATLPEKAKSVLAWPTAERLARLESPAAAKTLYGYAELMAPPHMVVANDNNPDLAAPEADPDMVQELRPGDREMLKAASDGLRCAVTSVRKDGRWIVADRRQVTFGLTYIDGICEGFRLGNLHFRDGQLLSYGQTSKGNRKIPTERRRQPKGYSTPPPRSLSSIMFLLPANDDTPIASGAGWLGGVSRTKGNTTTPDLGDHEASVEIDRNARRAAVRLALGLDAAVLDAAITDASAKEIGEAFGYHGKTAERQGIGKINDAIRKLQQLAA